MEKVGIRTRKSGWLEREREKGEKSGPYNKKLLIIGPSASIFTMILLSSTNAFLVRTRSDSGFMPLIGSVLLNHY